MYSLAIAGNQLVAGGHDQHIWRWNISDPNNPQPLPTLTPGIGAIQAVAFDPSGTLLAAGGASGQIRIYRDGTQPTTASPWATASTWTSAR